MEETKKNSWNKVESFERQSLQIDLTSVQKELWDLQKLSCVR